MLDIRRIRENAEEVKAALAKRHGDYPIDQVLELDEKRRAIIKETEAIKAEQNKKSKEIPALKKAGEDTEEIFKNLKELSTRTKELDEKLKELDQEIKDLLLGIPNTPYHDVVEGESDADNVEVRKYKEPTKFDFEPKAH